VVLCGCIAFDGTVVFGTALTCGDAVTFGAEVIFGAVDSLARVHYVCSVLELELELGGVDITRGSCGLACGVGCLEHW